MQEWAKKIRSVIVGAAVTTLLFMPLYANALGFGSIKVKSALNEALDAEIELLSATDDDVKDLEVKLASREAFLRAGVDRSAQLAQIKFTIVKHGGSHYISLKTPQPVRDPFMNFLLEMNWKNGRMLREYTVLLDPPDRKPVQMAAAPEPTPPAVAPVIQPEPAPVAVAPATTPAPVMIEPAPVTPAPTQIAQAEPAPVPVAPVEAAAPVAESVAPAPVAETTKPAEDKKSAKKKKSSKKSAKGKDAKSTDSPVPSAQAAKAGDVPMPSAESAGAASKDDGLFPRLPLDSNNEIDVAALEASVKQSQQARKDEVIEVEPAPVPVAPSGAAPVTPTEMAKADKPVDKPTASNTEALAPVPVTPVDTQPVESQPAGALDYGITRKGDILWDIAKKLKPSEQVTVYQVMMALQQSNPDAFVKGNVHRLKANQVLRIEDPRLLSAVSKEEALNRYKEQTREWRDYMASVGAQVPRQAIVAGDAGTQPEASSGVTAGELKLTPPTGEGEGAGSGGSEKLAKKQNTDQLRKEVQKAVKEAEVERSKNKELANRVEDLEKELKRLENLVTIKDSDLAALQTKLKDVEKSRAKIKDVKPEAKPEPVVAEPVKPAPVAVEPVKPVEPPKPVDVAAATPAPITENATAENSNTPVEPAAAPVENKPESSKAPAPVAPVTPASGGFMSNIKGMMGGMGLYIVIGGAVLLLLLALVFVWIRRRNRIHFQESILKGGAAASGDSQLGGASSIISKPISTQSSLMTGGSGESSFLSDFAISGVSAIQAEDSEVDPLTEADVFMAYGRYEAAEERLNEAIKQDPNRGELRVKLLELYSTTKNKKAFEGVAEDFYSSLGGQAAGNALWQKAVSMGMEIAPNNPLFKGGAGGGFTNTSNLNDSKVMDIGLDTGAFTKSDFAIPEDKTVVKPKKAAPPPAEFNLDFDMETKPAASSAAKSKADDNSLEFNLDFGTSGSAASSSADKGNAGGLDFNLDKDEEPTATDIKFDMNDTSGGLDFDLESPGPTSGGSSNKPTVEMNLDATDAINLDMPSGGDEVGTKLDLARAYIDMGDPDGARSILDEVIAEGNDGQKAEAKQLMSQIG